MHDKKISKLNDSPSNSFDMLDKSNPLPPMCEEENGSLNSISGQDCPSDQPLNDIPPNSEESMSRLNPIASKLSSSCSKLNAHPSLEASPKTLDKSNPSSGCNCVGCLIFGDDLELLSQRKHLGTYTATTKLKVIHSVLSEDLSRRTIAKKYGLPHPRVNSWLNRYSTLKIFVSMAKYSPSFQSIDDMTLAELKQEFASLFKIYKQVSKELEGQSLRAFAFDKMIEVAESQLEISIRKKSGAKVSKRAKRRKRK